MEYLALNPTCVALLSDLNLRYMTAPEDLCEPGIKPPQSLAMRGALESAPLRSSRELEVQLEEKTIFFSAYGSSGSKSFQHVHKVMKLQWIRLVSMQCNQDRINKIIIHCSYVIIESKEVWETLRKINLKLSLWSDQIWQEQILVGIWTALAK